MVTSLEDHLTFKIRLLIILFMTGLVLSGITAFPIEAQLSLVNNNIHKFPGFTQEWLNKVFHAIKTTNSNFPFLSYGTDWLAFAHIVIAILFIGPRGRVAHLIRVLNN